jgi:hypothetical protein
VGLDGVEPSTSRLSGVRSNQTELQALRILVWPFTHHMGIWSKIEMSLLFIYQRTELDLSKLNSDKESGKMNLSKRFSILRKEVIQPLVPQRLPCYDFTPIISHTLGVCLLKG